eukprot:TRINITY_DN50049_c0_g1_i1.p1 TRINITY_DN50049_c0_g1~~TRINITY_DN50049_c0_g1_i1.p1  ORF type:complete len:789 (+),score=65.65 TRINITY_DN50049_c0_g1_i1:240-2369(+)
MSSADKATLPPSAHQKGERPLCRGCGDRGSCSSICAATGICLPINGTECAKEGGKCQCTGLVRYGIGSQFSSWKKVSGSIDCTNGVFGDPAPGMGGKACQCSQSGPCDSTNGTAGACCKKGDLTGPKECLNIPDGNYLHSGNHHQCVLTVGSVDPGVNTYRNYPQTWSGDLQMPKLFNNPCKYVNDMFQALNYLAEDGWDAGEKKIQATSGDHGKIARKGGYRRWTGYETEVYSQWQRPAHEHGHTAHYTLMRVYNSMHSLVRGISSEGFAEVISMYVMACHQSWMMQGLTYYPSIPLSFELKWDDKCCSTTPGCNPCGHIFKSSQPYQEPNIYPVKSNVHDPPGLGARFYGMGFWWTYVAQFVGKPYIIGRLATDNGKQAWGSNQVTLQKFRFYLSQEGFDLGDLFGNFVAHLSTFDFPFVGKKYAMTDGNPFKGIDAWCPLNVGAGCSVDQLKVHVSIDGSKLVPKSACDAFPWISGPVKQKPGGYASNTIRVSNLPANALVEIGLEFEVPDSVYADKAFHINFNKKCKDDPRMFSNRIVVEDTTGQSRPAYYKLPGRLHDSVIIKVPTQANIYLLAVPTPPFDLEDVQPFVTGYSLVWSYKYRIRRLRQLPTGRQSSSSITMKSADSMLELTKNDGFGLLYDCFEGYEADNYASPSQPKSCGNSSHVAKTASPASGSASAAEGPGGSALARISLAIIASILTLLHE